MKKICLILFLLASCTSSQKVDNLNFSDDISFEEFKLKLENYALNNPYPNIDD